MRGMGKGEWNQEEDEEKTGKGRRGEEKKEYEGNGTTRASAAKKEEEKKKDGRNASWKQRRPRMADGRRIRRRSEHDTGWGRRH